MNNISFQGKSSIIFDNKIYDSLTTKSYNRIFTNLSTPLDKNYKLTNGRFALFNPNQANNIGVLLFDGNEGKFFTNAESKILEILEHVEKMQATAKEKLTAWILGGRSNEQTIKKVNVLAEVLCDRPDMDTSILAGVRNDSPNLTLHPLKDNFNVSIDMPKINNSAEEELQKYFDIVELNNFDVQA